MRGRTPAAFALLAAAAVAFIALPLLGLIARAPWSQATAVISSPEALSALRLSLVVSTTAALITVTLGVPLAWVLTRARFPGRSLVRALAVLPLVLPPVVAGVALLAAFGRRGMFGPLLRAAGVQLPFSTAGAIVATAFVSLPLVVLAVESGLRSLDPRFEQAAAAMGASRWYAARRITLPLIAPQVLAGAVLAWARALGEFGATLMFAGNLQGTTQTLPLAVFQESQQDPGAALVLALVLVVVSVAVLFALRSRVLPSR
jgi:molybdate transport system permease protein